MTSLLYLLSIRLATLAIGAMTMFLGYRLLMQQQISKPSQIIKPDRSGELFVSVGIATIKLKNVAAGIFFTSFGALLVISTIIANPPQIDIKDTEETSKEGEKTDYTHTTKYSVRDVNETKKLTAKYLHKQAKTLNNSGKIKIAYELEKLAITLQPKDDLYLETAASYAFKNNDCRNALAYIKQAIDQQKSNSNYKDKLKKYEKGCQNHYP